MPHVCKMKLLRRKVFSSPRSQAPLPESRDKLIFIQAQNAVRESVDHAHIVSDQNDGQISFFFYFVQKVENSFFPADVNPGSRLVKKQDIGIADQSPSDKNALEAGRKISRLFFF